MKPLLISLCLLLLSGCGRPPEETEVDAPPLIRAAETGDLARLDQLLADSPQPDVRDDCRWTPLMKASLNGHVAVAERLIRLGADPDLTDKGGYSALHLAASRYPPSMTAG